MRGQLTINLKALQDNYKHLDSLSDAQCETAAVVKANAYGLGIGKVAPALYDAGARRFFVATLEEGAQLREILSEVRIYILNGFSQEKSNTYASHNLIPVLNSAQEIAAYQSAGGGAAVLHFDTGMNRLGIPYNQMPMDLNGLDIYYVMTHLSSSEQSHNRNNAVQLQRFMPIMHRFPDRMISIANSGGILLGRDYHMGLTRPGIALYGGMEGMQPVISLTVPVLQTRKATNGQSAGYNETYTFDKETTLAVVGAGYADGLPRTLSNKGALYWKGHRLPIRGNVSMDSIICDLSDVPEKDYPVAGDRVEVIGENQSLSALANDAGTITYEILTSLGARYERTWVS